MTTESGNMRWTQFIAVRISKSTTFLLMSLLEISGSGSCIFKELDVSTSFAVCRFHRAFVLLMCQSVALHLLQCNYTELSIVTFSTGRRCTALSCGGRQKYRQLEKSQIFSTSLHFALPLYAWVALWIGYRRTESKKLERSGCQMVKKSF